MYEWHETPYLGVAHGLAGICMVILQVLHTPQTSHCVTLEQTGLLHQVLAYISALRMETGNYPSRALRNKDPKDRLVQFCHGAPGIVLLFCLAHEVFGDANPEYLPVAEDAAETVWRFGLLKKGPGLCHGVAGNGYTLLAMYRVTKNAKYLDRARRFAEFSVSMVTDHSLRHELTAKPDYPLSLFEGKAGHACYIMDVLDPEHAYFPGVELPR